MTIVTVKKKRKYNRSTFYVLPMLGQPLSAYGDYFVNTFIRDENYPSYAEHIFVLFDAAIVTEAPVEYDCLCKLDAFIDEYCIGDYLMLVFEVPEMYYQDYKIFELSKYSKFSKLYKKVILRTWPRVVGDKTSLTIAALYPDSPKSVGHKATLEKKIGQSLPRGAEIISCIDMEKETFKLKDYYEVVS